MFTRITETFLSPSAVAPLPEVEGKVEESSQIQTSQGERFSVTKICDRLEINRFLVTPTRSVNTSDEIKGKVETKIISLWHNMKYGWSGKLKSNFNKGDKRYDDVYEILSDASNHGLHNTYVLDQTTPK